MSDGYAIDRFEELFVPKGWNVWRRIRRICEVSERKVQSGFAEHTYRGRDEACITRKK